MVTTNQTTHLIQYILSQFDAHAPSFYLFEEYGLHFEIGKRFIPTTGSRIQCLTLMKCERVSCISHAPVATNPGQALMRKLFLFNSDMAHTTFYCSGFYLRTPRVPETITHA